MSIGTIAMVCKRGHLITLESGEGMPPYCSECGAEGVTECSSCEAPIAGIAIENVDAHGNLDASGWTRPSFCNECGSAFPWIDRRERIYELQNRLDREQLDQGDALAAREQLEALADPNLTEDEQVKRWKRLRELAPKFWENSQTVITDLVTAYAKRKLGL
jgi:hypothetical protein